MSTATAEETLTIADRVANGTAYLEEHFPDWRDRIDVAGLDMGHEEHCVMGQLMGNYDQWSREAEVSTDAAYRLGLYERWTADTLYMLDDRYALLTRAWRQYLTDGVLTDPTFHG